MSRSPDQILKAAYAAFNSRNVDAALNVMCTDVEWPNGMEGGVVLGHAGVREYWTRQWGLINPTVEPLKIRIEPDGRYDFEVHQLVKVLQGNVLADRIVHYVY